MLYHVHSGLMSKRPTHCNNNLAWLSSHFYEPATWSITHETIREGQKRTIFFHFKTSAYVYEPRAMFF